MYIINEIRAVAALKKNAVAISFEDTEITYGEFVQRIDGLATALRSLHIGNGDRIAIALPRSFEMIIAIFGVLSVGATYVPLDPANPQSRLINILEDSKASLLLSDDEGKNLALSSGVKLLHTKDWPSNGPIVNSVKAETAYIIYTSGSTGKPKGVEIGYPALENYLKWATTELPFTGDGVPLFTSISFDHAITNIFPPLLKGEKIVLLPPILGGRALASALFPKNISQDKRYSYIKITPSLFGFLDKEQRAHLGCHTNLLMFGGEKLSPDLISDARYKNPGLAIMNHYGPTETTVGCCVYNVSEKFTGAVVPIGKPIPGVEVSIRQADLSIADSMEVGELFVSGKALANGYWQRPDLTEKAFLNLSEDILLEKRWYRTGDLVRRAPHGNLEYLGRIDDQIKILGHRIEPLEIIEHLNTFSNVKQSAVFVHSHATYNELIGVLTFFDRKSSGEEVRKHLQNFLPPAMVPTRYLILDEIPLHASGKIDVKKLHTMLPEIQHDLSVEELLLDKFREVLCLEHIGPEDDYFLLGGDSLGTVEIATWAAEHYNISLEISCLFDFPTIASLSRHIRNLMGSRAT